MFTKEMQKALELDRKKLEHLGMPQNPILWGFRCNKCGATGEEKFSWDGGCLVCEDGEPDCQEDIQC